MRIRGFAGFLLVAASVPACALVLGDFDDKGATTSGVGGSAASTTSTSGAGGGCMSGQLFCGTCVDPSTDNNNCGACHVVCGGASFCKSAKCACLTAGQSYCPGVGCIDTTGDKMNCGGCGLACAGSMACVNGHCGPDGSACTAGADCSTGQCVGGICCATGCTDKGAASCSTNGKCVADGSACALYPSGTTCAAASCSGSTLQGASNCDGQGACKAGAAAPCGGNFACANGGACKTVCGTASDCAASKFTCGTIGATSGQCLLKPGQPCVTGNQCASDGCSGSGCL